MRRFIWRLRVFAWAPSRASILVPSHFLKLHYLHITSNAIDCVGFLRVVFGGEVTKLGGTCALLKAPYASYNWRVAFIWVYFYLFNEETRPDITRVTHSPRELNSWREKESVARPLTTREIMSPLLPSLVYQELTACGCAQKQCDLQGNRDRWF